MITRSEAISQKLGVSIEYDLGSSFYFSSHLTPKGNLSPLHGVGERDYIGGSNVGKDH